jgi:hypothetical protein
VSNINPTFRYEKVGSKGLQVGPQGFLLNIKLVGHGNANTREYASEVSQSNLGGILSVIIFIFICHLIGTFIVGRFFKFLPKYPFLGIALGMIFFSYLFTFLGMAHILTERLLICILVTCGVSSAILLRNTFKLRALSKLFKKFTLTTAILIAASLGALFSLGDFFYSFTKPLVGYDALAYHAYLPWYAMNFQHSLRPDALVPNAGLPLGAQGILAWLIPTSKYNGLGVLNLFYLFATLMIILKSTIHKGRNAAALNVVLALCIFLLAGNIVLTSPSSDLVLGFFSVLFMSIIISSQTKAISNPQIFVIVLLNGFIAFIKPFALVLTLPLLFLTFRKSKLTGLQKIFSFLGGIMPYISWLIYNYVYTGNPFFPIFQGIFKGVGFGPEVMTNEQDVRRSFSQLGAYLSNKTFDFAQIQASDLQILFSVGIAISSIVHMLIVFRKDRQINPILLSTNASYLALLMYIGPIWRYFIFLNIAQLLSIYATLPSVTIGKGLRSKPKQRHLPVTLIVVSLFILTLNKVSLEYKATSLPITPALRGVGLTVNELNFQEVIEYLNNQSSKRILLFGEGRAAAFYPNSVLTLPADRRNPFSDPNISNLDHVVEKLKSFDRDLLIIASDWGWAKNVEIGLLQDFASKYKSSIVFSTNGWSVYDISNIE